jgi:hypothetical protein
LPQGGVPVPHGGVPVPQGGVPVPHGGNPDDCACANLGIMPCNHMIMIEVAAVWRS